MARQQKARAEGGAEQIEPPDALSASAADETGARHASLIVLAGWEIGQEIELRGNEQVLGRSPLANVSLMAPSMAGRHARIKRKCSAAAVWFEIEDLASGSGTYVNGESVKRTALRTGDKIQLGDVLFKFVVHDPIEARFYQEVHRRIHYHAETGLLTHEAFRRVLHSHITKSPPDPCFSVAMTDLDGLKRVNDRFGHSAGLQVVSQMGGLIRENLRTQDRAGLFGGDETLILFPGASVEEARPVAENVRAAVERHEFEHGGARFHVTISIGLAQWPDHGYTMDEITGAADKALYAAKAAGRNCVLSATS